MLCYFLASGSCCVIENSLHEDLGQGLVEALEDLAELLVTSSSRSSHGLVQVLVR